MGFFLIIALVVLIAILALKAYIIIRTNKCKSQTCLAGKTAIITGANTGIGYETALDFAKRGAKVILACRNQEKADEARTKIIIETQNENIFVKIVNMASFDSIRAFAKDINENEERLDILVNNAGAYSLEDERTVDGLPLLMQVNYFSGFLLTILLLKLLKKSSPSRIVNVSSMAAKFAKSFELTCLDKFSSVKDDYYNSKLCNVLFTIELAKKLHGTNVTTYSLHPGFISTDIFHNIKGAQKVFHWLLVKLFSITCEEGAQTNIYCGVAKNIEQYNGEHFDSCQRVNRYETAKNSDLAKKLWKRTEELIQLKPKENPF